MLNVRDTNMHALIDNVLALPGALLLAACLLGKFIKSPVRRTFGRKVYEIAYRQHKDVARLQARLRHPLFNALATVTALTVTVEFYLLFLPPIVWLIRPHGSLAFMTMCQCMAISTYMTCVLKDMLSCPRPYMFPSVDNRHGSSVTVKTGGNCVIHADATTTTNVLPSPPCDAGWNASAVTDLAPAVARAQAPAAKFTGALTAPTQFISGQDSKAHDRTGDVAVLEDAYRDEVEYGAPSMHTWCALVLPGYAATLAQQLGVISVAHGTVATVGAALWAGWVAFTRLYLGVHTPVDLVLGAVSGGAFLGLWRRIGLVQLAWVGLGVPEGVTKAGAMVLPTPSFWLGLSYAQGQALTLLAVGLSYLVALATYPMPESHTTSYEYAVIFLGSAYGGLVACTPHCSLISHLLNRVVVNDRGSKHATAADVLAALIPEALRHPIAVLLLGFSFIAAVKQMSKALLVELLPRLLDCAPRRLRLSWQPPVHPSGCAVATATSTFTPESSARRKAKEGSEQLNECAAGVRVKQARKPAGPGTLPLGVLMKTPTLPYDVDFLRKFLNYGVTVYAVVEFQHLAEVLLMPGSQPRLGKRLGLGGALL